MMLALALPPWGNALQVEVHVGGSALEVLVALGMM